MLDVIREKSIICDEKANKTFAELKSIIDKITAGVKSACYLEAEVKSLEYMVFKLDEKSNDFIKEKYLYDVNGSVRNDSLFLWDFEGKYLNEIFNNNLNDKTIKQSIDTENDPLFTLENKKKKVLFYTLDLCTIHIILHIFRLKNTP